MKLSTPTTDPEEAQPLLRRRILRRLRGGVFRNSSAARGRRAGGVLGGARGMRRLRADVRRGVYTLILLNHTNNIS